MSSISEKLSLALQYQESGNFTEAEEIYKQIIDEDPNNDSALYFLGVIAYQLKNYDAAINYIRKASEIQPLSRYHRDLGDILIDKGDIEAAIECYKKSINIDPGDIDSYYNLGLAFRTKKSFQEAINCYRKVIALNSNDFEAYYELGTALKCIKEYNEAISCYEKTITINPGYAEAYNGLGLIFQETNLYDNAIQCYKKVIELKPDYTAYYNMALCLYNKWEVNEAIKCCLKGLELNPNSVDIRLFLGILYFTSGNFDEAEKHYEEILAIEPDNPKAWWGLGLHYLAKKQFEKGWQALEYRMKCESNASQRASTLSKPKWDGSDINGKTVYVFYEQGFGDIIQFIRYLPLIHSRGSKIILKVKPQLEQLFRQSDLKADIIINDSTPDTQLDYDFYIPVCSLPYIFKTNENNIPLAEGYLKADPEKVKIYKEKYFNNNLFKIGIVWQSNLIFPRDRNRRIPHVSYLYSITQLPNTKVYSLQKGDTTKQLANLPEEIEIINLGDEFNDLSDTAAAIENLDLVITIDTSVAHLSGALSKPTWIMLSHIPACWKWFPDRETFPWYKSVRLFQQKEQDDWSELIERITIDLRKLITSKDEEI